ncbi:intracellular sulfur oxidation DsrE/DsrF family protein [Hydrogenivirga caldilitoris]|uniref:Intracellular sulfur oxidation DsrE/DsrF family protein n=1 Tax=Hydrogenivirga caldilitoris TaxID=246264 RepID=A0A497XQR5_9AQUI|nr:DsrE family protein [Hydrogenivirga caldilitoris]RLJ71327.1 intracellular sulfur oxidation DsrE/DsrF family protein [Hydrogenivirga caldilitoris]
MRRRDLLLGTAGVLTLLTPLRASSNEEIKLLFPVTFRDRKRWKKVFLRIRGAINLWEARADIEVVAYDEGITFLDRFENGEFEERIENLMLHGVEFKACKVAMNMFNVSEEALFDGVEVVRSGFEYHVLKVKEGYIPIYL